MSNLLPNFAEWWATVPWFSLLGQEPLEIVGTVAGVLGLILLAKEKRSGWLVGIIWSGVSAYLTFFSWHLLSDTVMYLVYIPIQLYCWHTWGKDNSAHGILPTWLSREHQLLLVIGILLCIGAWAMTVAFLAQRIAWLPEPSMLWRDAATTVMNFIAQFLMAKKRMENWILWIIINVMGIHIYALQGSTIYAFQYALFLLLGIYGWWQWHQHRQQSSLHASPAAEAV